MALKDDFPRWHFGDSDHDCHTNMSFADDVLLFASTKEQLQKMMCDFKRSTGKVALKIHPGKTKILSSQSSNSGTENGDSQQQSGNINLRRKHQLSWTDGYTPETGDNREQESDQGCLGDVFYKYKQKLTSKS